MAGGDEVKGKWKETEIGDILVEKGYIRGPFGSSLKRGEMKDSGIPVYEQKNAIYNSRDFRFFIDEDKFNELKRFQVRTNDLIISCSGTVGKISIIKEEDPKGIISQALLILRPNTEKIELLYLYYFLSSRQGFALLTQASHGSVQINIAERKVVESIPLLLPPLPEQRAIASVLSSLDDKIDLLHRQNKTLEAMAETLFRQWFVEEADEEWEEGVLGDVIEILDHKRIPLSKMERNKMKEGRLYPYYGAATILDYVNNYIFDGEYILLGEDGTVRTEEGYPVLQYATGKFWVNNHAHVIKAKQPYNNFFIWNYLSITNIDRIVTGAVQPKINQTNLKTLEFPKFPDELLAKFKEVTESQFDKINKNKAQIRTLEKMRDTLLPKLMSGEVRVKLAQEEAAR
ncbi:MAG: restriction endonuclease subunit S [Euryarchaeota archaeon]|nr:restriction endonuclease subunit S [Euryarchaeota archaeon]